MTAFCMVVGLLQGLEKLNLFEGTINVSAAPGLENGNYIFLDASTNWKDAGAVMWIYCYNSGGKKWYKMTQISGTDMWYVQINSYMKKDIIFVRGNSSTKNFADSEMSWDYKWNQTADLSFSSFGSGTNGNTYTITGWNSSGKFSSDWNYSYKNNTMYFYSYDESQTTVTAKFYSSKSPSAEAPVAMTKAGNLYSCTIPAAANSDKYPYDKVCFMNASNQELCNADIIKYDPNTNNTYYYQNTKYSGGTFKSVGWSTHPVSGAISGKALYFSNTNFPVGSGNHLYVNGTEVPLTVNDTESGDVYSYTYSGSQDAIFKFVNSSGTEYRFLWSETGKNLVTVDSNDVASVSGKFNALYHYIYFSTEIVPEWNDADCISWLRYLDSTNTIEPSGRGGYQINVGTLGWTKMTRVDDPDTGVTYWQVQLLSAIEDASGIQFVRGTPYSSGLSDDEMFWDRVSGSSTRTLYSYSSVIGNNAMTENTNMYTINKNAGGDYTNQGGTLSKLGNGGEYLYFYNMNRDNSIVEAHFISFDGVTNKIVAPMSEINGLYTYVIPSEQAYKYVEFYVDNQPINATDNRYNIMLNDGTSQDGRYDPTTNNTYYYRNVSRNVSNGSNDTLASQGWFTHPKTGTITGKTLYFSNIDFPVGSGDKLYIDEAEVSLTVVDSNTYSYVYTGSQDAMFRFVYSTGEVYNFLWHDASSELVSIDGDIAVVSGSYVQGDIRTVYYDASYSKQEYGGADGSNGKGTTGQYSIPNASGIIRYYATAPGTSYAPRSGSMKKVAETTSTDGVHTYSDLYKCVLPEVYTHIIFSSFELSSESDAGTSGNRTQYMEIPSGYSNPCFYADTSDPYVFYSDTFPLNGSTVDNLRSGVWKEAFDGIRTTVTDPVDIPHKTEVRENSESKLYQTVTLYDYYTDYELNGMNRDDIDDITYSPTPPYRDSIGNHRTYQPFRQFNAALSSYFEENNIKNPIYWGNFQHYAGSNFGAIADTINLFGMTRKDFYYLNNGSWASGYFDGYAGFDPNYAGRIKHDGSSNSSNATQGIMDDTMSGENIMMEDEAGSDAYIAPFFDKAFLEGNNSKNARIGKVYENVTFPFKKRLMKSKSRDDLNGKVEYWYFDSKETDDGNPKTDANEYLDSGLRLYQDSATGSYFLDESRSVKVSGAPQFLPFNEHSQGSSSENKLDRLNYGFGMRIEIKFRLTEDGMIRTDSATEEYAPIEFRFEGDDDVWVYVDGNLALDIGGQHGIVTGYLDFSGDTSTKKAYVDYVKDGSEVNISESTSTTNFSMKGNNTDEHTLVMYYMERGLFESNLYMSFNFLSANTLEVEKEVDTSDVNPIFTNNTVEIAGIAGTQNIDVFDQYRSKDFTFGIKNFATHFPEKTSQVNNEAFDIKQYEIRSYGSVGEGGFVNPVGADYARNYRSNVPGDTNKVKKWICSDCGEIVYQAEEPTVCSSCSNSGSNQFHEDIMQIDASGEFTVKDGESVEFVDQFRRGSYLYLEEKDTFSENPNLFRTKWTMYENGYKVVSLNEDSSPTNKTVTNAGSYPNGLVDIESRYVNDGRIESYLTGVSGSMPIANSGYTTAARPSADSAFVFRSYEDPGRVNGSTTLKALYTNSVNVDTLKIGKSNIYDEDAGRLNGVYTFNVEFSNVGGEFLERMWKCSDCEAIVNSKTAPIECSDCGASGASCHFDLIYRHVCLECGTTVLGTESQKPATCSNCGASGDKIQQKDYAIVITRTIDFSNADTSDDSFTIEGIPIGTHFKVVEANVSDNSYLVDVIDEDSNVKSNEGNSYSGVIERVWKCSDCGQIEKQESQPVTCSNCGQNDTFEDVTYSFIFRNALKTEVPVEKVWKDESGNDVDNSIKQPVSFVLQKKNRNTGNWQTLVYNSQTKSYSPFEFDEIYGIYNSSLTDYESYVKRSSTTGEYSRVSYDSGTDSYVPDASTPLNLKTVKLGSIDISDRLTYYYEYNSTTGEWEKYRYSEDTHTWVKNSDRTVVYTLKSSATDSENWKRTLSDIPKYEKITDSTWDLCQYRILELDNVTGRVIEPGDTVTLKYDSIADKTFEVTYKNYWVCDECGTENAYNFSGGNTCSNTGYVHTNPDHDGYFSARITNTISNKTSISIIKVDAADTSRTLSNVKFKIEKVSADGSTVDTTYHAYECDVCGHISFGYNTPDQCVSCNAQSSHMSVINGYVREEVTDSVGRLRFNDLPDGIYRITETSTQDGYSLLTSPIYIKINKQTDTYGIYNITTQSIEAGGTLTLENNTITITVKNRAAFRFPDTGGNGKTILGLIGLFLIWMSGMIYIKRKIKESGHIKHG